MLHLLLIIVIEEVDSSIFSFRWVLWREPYACGRGWGSNLGAAISCLWVLGEFPHPPELQSGDRFTNLVEFHLEEIKAYVQMPDTQTDPTFFFFSLQIRKWNVFHFAVVLFVEKRNWI